MTDHDQNDGYRPDPAWGAPGAAPGDQAAGQGPSRPDQGGSQAGSDPWQQPGYGQGQYGQPQYGQPHDGPRYEPQAPEYGRYGQPGYGQPGYGQQPPEYGQYQQPRYGQYQDGQPGPGQQYDPTRPDGAATLPGTRPGIVPLRPLNFGDIFGGSVDAIRHNPKTMLGVSAVFYGIVTLLGMALLALAWTAARSNPAGDPDFSTNVNLGSLGSFLLAAFLAPSVFGSVLGRKVSPGQAWRSVKGRVWSLIGSQLLVGLGVVVLIAVVVLLVVGIGAGTGVFETEDAGVGLVLGAVGLLLLFLLAIGLLSTYFALAGPAIVAERLGPIRGLKRSVQLVRGGFWRTFGILVAVTLATSVVAGILLLPLGILAAIVGAALTGGDATSATFSTLFAMLIGGAVASIFTQPFAAAATVLLYLDRRMRKEGVEPALATASDLVRTAEGVTPPAFGDRPRDFPEYPQR